MPQTDGTAAQLINQIFAQVTPPASKYGLRQDGTPKGDGFLGPLTRPDGKVSTELSIGVNMDGKEVEIPSLVPTLAPDEIQHLLQGGAPTPEIVQKAISHAQQRIQSGLSPFAAPGESPPQ